MKFCKSKSPKIVFHNFLFFFFWSLTLEPSPWLQQLLFSFSVPEESQMLWSGAVKDVIIEGPALLLYGRTGRI